MVYMLHASQLPVLPRAQPQSSMRRPRTLRLPYMLHASQLPVLQRSQPQSGMRRASTDVRKPQPAHL